MISVLIIIIKVLVLLGFLITIHELGHFTVAKLCNIKVNEFSIGFGPTIFKKQGKETKYSLRLIPLGGYVSMEGEEKKSEDKRSFTNASVLKRMAVVSAGAIVNIVFALLVIFTISAINGTYISNKVGETVEGYSAQQAGIKSGDKIIQINEKTIKNYEDIDEAMVQATGEEMIVKIKREEEIIEYKIKPTPVEVKTTGIYLSKDAKIMLVEKGSISEEKGIQTNDKIKEVNGIEINEDGQKVLEIISESKSTDIQIVLERNGEEIKVELTPEIVTTYYLGVDLTYAEDTIGNRLINGVMNTSNFVKEIIQNLKQLFTGKTGIDQMVGPVGISGIIAETNGIKEFIQMMALISISLGVTNLLPIPALDGGKLLILLIEAIRRKPINQELEMKLQLLGFSILIALSLYITYKDIYRILK